MFALVMLDAGLPSLTPLWAIASLIATIGLIGLVQRPTMPQRRQILVAVIVAVLIVLVTAHKVSAAFVYCLPEVWWIWC